MQPTEDVELEGLLRQFFSHHFMSSDRAEKFAKGVQLILADKGYHKHVVLSINTRVNIPRCQTSQHCKRTVAYWEIHQDRERQMNVTWICCESWYEVKICDSKELPEVAPQWCPLLLASEDADKNEDYPRCPKCGEIGLASIYQNTCTRCANKDRRVDYGYKPPS